MGKAKQLLSNVLCTAAMLPAVVHAKRRGGGGGEDSETIQRFEEVALYVFGAVIALVAVGKILGVILRRLTRQSAAQAARERSVRKIKSKT